MPPAITQPLVDDLVYANETCFAMCKPCVLCHGSGRSQDQSKLYNPSLSLEDIRCKECRGRGYSQEFLSLDQLYQLLSPILMEDVVKHLPEIIAKTQLAVIESVMES